MYIALNKKANQFNFIKKKISKYKNFKLITSKRNYLKALNTCNISITSIGVSVWERFYIGIPCMVFSKEKRENIILEKLVKNKAVLKYYINNNLKNLNYFSNLSKFKKILKKIATIYMKNLKKINLSVYTKRLVN